MAGFHGRYLRAFFSPLLAAQSGPVLPLSSELSRAAWMERKGAGGPALVGMEVHTGAQDAPPSHTRGSPMTQQLAFFLILLTKS